MKIKASGGALRNAVISVPGDKSISHRSIIFGSIADGITEVSRCLMGADVLSTIGCFRQMGARIEVENDRVRIEGVGPRGLQRPANDLDAGNAGTCMRLVTGVLAGQPFVSRFVGDHSLSRRPMRRIIAPMELMGARVRATAEGTAPLEIEGLQPLRAIDYELPVASAQIKSAVLLAGLYADGPTSVVEPERVRDHTERMLGAFGCEVKRDETRVTVTPGPLKACDIAVPGDISSAAFFIVAGLLAADGELTLTGVGLNPLRTGVIDILTFMGGRIAIENRRTECGEDVGDIVVRRSELVGIEVPVECVSRAIDEFPIIFVAAAFARGTTVVTGAAELRVKESDRIAAMVDGLRKIGIDVVATPDGAVIQGTAGAFTRGGCTIETSYDHRIAMSFAIASLHCSEPLVILDADSIATSFPDFATIARGIGVTIAEQP